MPDALPDMNVVEMAAEIVSAYVRNNSVPVSELPVLLQSVHDALDGVLNGAKPEAAKEPPQPKVPIKRSVTHDYIICLEDGKRFKSLKRHLHSAYGLSPQEYRDKWGLPKDYPMVAPAYADARSNLAKTMGLGRKAAAASLDAPATEMPEPEAELSGEPAPEPEAAPEPELALEPASEPDPAPAAEAPEPAAESPEPAKKARRGRAKAPA